MMATVKLFRPSITLAVIATLLFGALIAPFRPTPRALAADAPVVYDAAAGASNLTLKDSATSDDAKTTGTVGGRTAVQLTGDSLYFDVGDSYMAGSTFAAIEFTYYDQGFGFFFLEYDSATGPNAYQATFSDPGRLFLNDTRQWITGTIYLSDARFQNSQWEAGADFRIDWWGTSKGINDNPAKAAGPLAIARVAVYRGSALTDLPYYNYNSASPVSYQPQSGMVHGGATDRGIRVITGPANSGANVRAVSQSGQPGTQVSTQGYAILDVYDTHIYNGSPSQNVRLDLEYYDDGTNQAVRIEYDSAAGAYAGYREFFLTGPAGWRTKTFYLTDAVFANRQVHSTDIRINDYQENHKGQFIFGGVTVTRNTTAPSYGSATSVSFAAPGTENGLSIVSAGTADTTVSYVTAGPESDRRAAIQLSSTGSAYFDADNTFIYQGKTGAGADVSDVQVEVSYLDKGYGYFFFYWDSTASATSPAQSFNLYLRTDNAVYLSNTNTWLTYTFNLPNVYFGNRENMMVGQADLRLAYPIDATANQGYLLAFDKVTIRRAATPLDRTGALNGNSPGYGDPVAVWTRLASVNDRGHGLYQIESAAATTATTVNAVDPDVGGSATTIQVRQASSGAISFDVNDNYVLNGNARDVYVGVEYYDDGFGSFWLEYDAGAGNRNKQTSSVTSGSSTTMKRTFFYLTDAYFGNGQDGGADFRIKTSGTALKVRTVMVQRAVGSQVLPRATVNTSAMSSFGKSQRVVAAHYFPVFDGYYPSLWETSSMGPAGANPITHTLTSYSWRSIDTLKQELEDAKAVGIDVLLFAYTGNTADAAFMGVQTLRNLVAAARQVSNPPKLGILLDPLMPFAETKLKDKGSTSNLLDFSDPKQQALLLKVAVDLFSVVPTDLWAAVDGRPLVFVYYQGTDMVSRYDATMFDALRSGFVRAFGVQPYLVADYLYDAHLAGGVSASVDEFFSWGAAYCGNASDSSSSCPAEAPGYAQNNVMEIGPGFDAYGLKRQRDNGSFYTRSWQRAIAKGMHMVAIDTFNYWVEGSAIGDSDLYGRQYLTITQQYAAQYKQTTYSAQTSVNTTLGTTNVSQGVYLDRPRGDQGTTVVSKGGKEGRSPVQYNMFFSIDDSFLFDVPNGKQIQITIEYWDEAVSPTVDSFFDLKYDGQSGVFSWDSTRTRQTIGHSQTWKTATVTLTDTAFRNRQDEKNDFVLVAQNPGQNLGGLIVRSIQVTRPADMVTKITTPSSGVRVDIGVGGAAVESVTRTLQVSYNDGSTGSWTATVDKSWLTLSKSNGTAPETIVLTVDPSGISSQGKTNDVATITFTSSTGQTSQLQVYARIGEAAFRIRLPGILKKSSAGGW